MFAFKTKARSLEAIGARLTSGTVLPIKYYTSRKWKQDPRGVISDVQDFFKTGKVIIRSSCHQEDQADKTNAGAFHSEMNVAVNDDRDLHRAVETVFASYGNDIDELDEVLIQPMLTDSEITGVAFTRDITTLAPYFVINYDETGEFTDSVTSGRTNQLKTYVCFKNKKKVLPRFVPLITCLEEIEGITGIDYLDVEFALKGDRAFILQVRPVNISNKRLFTVDRISLYLRKIEKKIKKVFNEHPYAAGRSTILGVMTDWNPAEMIGIRPRPLALSLYKELITDTTWAIQRYIYGYRDLRSAPLLISLLGIPYIDIRSSFTSFIPRELPAETSNKLANYYLKQLRGRIEYHDKIEFQVVFSCASLSINEDLALLEKQNFSREEIALIRDSLVRLTQGIIKEKGCFSEDLEKIRELQHRQDHILEFDLPVVDKLYWLIQDCKKYGTLPFAGLARAGFIAVQFLNSFVAKGILTEEEKNRFLMEITTISKKMAADYIELERPEFKKIYGHLRPGTYDILSERYDEALDSYFSVETGYTAAYGEARLSLSSKKGEMAACLKDIGLSIDPDELLDFIRAAIEAREYSKFIFSKSVSEALELIKKLFLKYGLTVEDASYVDIHTLLGLYSELDHRDLFDILRETSQRNQRFFEYSKIIKLPDVLTDSSEVYSFHVTDSKPNYISLSKVRAEMVPESRLKQVDLAGKILMISSADPGFDWVFAKKIAGLITLYGGANSHMAIRAAEMDIPAVIGAGEKFYAEWGRAETLEIDCEKQIVRIIHETHTGNPAAH